jgi:hypothetical protein
MPDYRTMFDDKWLKAWDLDGREFTVTIAKVEGGEVFDPKTNKKTKKPVLWFKGARKPLAINKTIGAVIAGMYGAQVQHWPGKQVTLFPTTTTFGKDTVDCIRVRPGVPTAKGSEPIPDRPVPPDDGATEPMREAGAEG